MELNKNIYIFELNERRDLNIYKKKEAIMRTFQNFVFCNMIGETIKEGYFKVSR